MRSKGVDPEAQKMREGLERQRRADGWALFAEYHGHQAWAKQQARVATEDNRYIAPETVDYLRGEVERRRLRAQEFEAKEKAEKERYAKPGIENLSPSHAAERGAAGADVGGSAGLQSPAGSLPEGEG